MWNLKEWQWNVIQLGCVYVWCTSCDSKFCSSSTNLATELCFKQRCSQSLCVCVCHLGCVWFSDVADCKYVFLRVLCTLARAEEPMVTKTGGEKWRKESADMKRVHLFAWDEMKWHCGAERVEKWEGGRGRKAVLGKSVCRVIKEDEEKESEWIIYKMSQKGADRAKVCVCEWRMRDKRGWDCPGEREERLIGGEMQ